MTGQAVSTRMRSGDRMTGKSETTQRISYSLARSRVRREFPEQGLMDVGRINHESMLRPSDPASSGERSSFVSAEKKGRRKPQGKPLMGERVNGENQFTLNAQWNRLACTASAKGRLHGLCSWRGRRESQQ